MAAAPQPYLFTEEPCKLVGGGSYAKAFACDVSIIKRVTLTDYSDFDLGDTTLPARNVFASLHMLGSNHTRELTGTREPGIIRMRHVAAKLEGSPSTGKGVLEITTLLPRMQQDLGKGLGAEDPLRIAHQLLRTVAGMHARGIRHRDIKGANILMTAGRVALADFDTAFVPQWDGAPATMLVETGTYAYFPPLEDLSNRVFDASVEANYSIYVAEHAAESEDAWALSATLWELFFKDQLAPSTEATPRKQWQRLTEDGYVETARARLRQLILKNAKTAEEKLAFERLFERMFSYWSGKQDLSAAALLAALVPGETPQQPSWSSLGMNPIAHVLQHRHWEAACRELLEKYAPVQAMLDAALAGALRQRSHLTVWRLLVFAGALFHALTLLAAYYVSNPRAVWPPAKEDADLLDLALYVAIVQALPPNWYVLSGQFVQEPISILYMYVCGRLGMLPRVGYRGVDQEYLLQARAFDREPIRDSSGKIVEYMDATGNASKAWATVMVRIVNQADRLFGYNLCTPGTLQLLSRAARLRHPPQQEPAVYVNPPRHYDAEFMLQVRELLKPDGASRVRHLHLTAASVPRGPDPDLGGAAQILTASA